MAYLSDIEAALARIAAETLIDGDYPFGDLVVSTLGPRVRIYIGWPVASDLDADIAASKATGSSHNPSLPIVNVSIYTRPTGVVTTRYLDIWREGPEIPQIMFANLSGQILTLSGVVDKRAVLGITLGGVNYNYRPSADDKTLSDVAAHFAELVPDAVATGSSIQLKAIPTYSGIMTDARMYRELRRQTQSFLVTVWAPDPQSRDLIASVLEIAFAKVRALDLPDGSGTSPVETMPPIQTDDSAKGKIWRVDLPMSVNFATTLTEYQPITMFPVAKVG